MKMTMEVAVRLVGELNEECISHHLPNISASEYKLLTEAIITDSCDMIMSRHIYNHEQPDWLNHLYRYPDEYYFQSIHEILFKSAEWIVCKEQKHNPRYAWAIHTEDFADDLWCAVDKFLSSIDERLKDNLDINDLEILIRMWARGNPELKYWHADELWQDEGSWCYRNRVVIIDWEFFGLEKPGGEE
jgi:hypothetical protein